MNTPLLYDEISKTELATQSILGLICKALLSRHIYAPIQSATVCPEVQKPHCCYARWDCWLKQQEAFQLLDAPLKQIRW